MFRQLYKSLGIACLTLFSCATLLAQVTADAALTGVVKDSSGAGIEVGSRKVGTNGDNRGISRRRGSDHCLIHGLLPERFLPLLAALTSRGHRRGFGTTAGPTDHAVGREAKPQLDQLETKTRK